jgi:hypothetical protein
LLLLLLFVLLLLLLLLADAPAAAKASPASRTRSLRVIASALVMYSSTLDSRDERFFASPMLLLAPISPAHALLYATNAAASSPRVSAATAACACAIASGRPGGGFVAILCPAFVSGGRLQ